MGFAKFPQRSLCSRFSQDFAAIKEHKHFSAVASSARSQLAEGFAKQLLGDTVEIESAGSHPTRVNPYASRVLGEMEVDYSSFYSKSVNDLRPDFIADLDYVITLCAEEVCPTLNSKAKKIHWPLPDPAGKHRGVPNKWELSGAASGLSVSWHD
jgi:arsenate reductase